MKFTKYKRELEKMIKDNEGNYKIDNGIDLYCGGVLSSFFEGEAGPFSVVTVRAFTKERPHVAIVGDNITKATNMTWAMIDVALSMYRNEKLRIRILANYRANSIPLAKLESEGIDIRSCGTASTLRRELLRVIESMNSNVIVETDSKSILAIVLPDIESMMMYEQDILIVDEVRELVGKIRQEGPASNVHLIEMLRCDEILNCMSKKYVGIELTNHLEIYGGSVSLGEAYANSSDRVTFAYMEYEDFCK